MQCGAWLLLHRCVGFRCCFSVVPLLVLQFGCVVQHTKALKCLSINWKTRRTTHTIHDLKQMQR